MKVPGYGTRTIFLSAKVKTTSWVKLSHIWTKFGFDIFFDWFGLNMMHYIIVESMYLGSD